MNLTFEIISNGNGYMIKNNGINWIEQETFIPYPGETIEESAQNHIDFILEEPQSQQKEVTEIERLRAKTAELEQTIDSILTEILPALLGQ